MLKTHCCVSWQYITSLSWLTAVIWFESLCSCLLRTLMCVNVHLLWFCSICMHPGGSLCQCFLSALFPLGEVVMLPACYLSRWWVLQAVVLISSSRQHPSAGECKATHHQIKLFVILICNVTWLHYILITYW